MRIAGLVLLSLTLVAQVAAAKGMSTIWGSELALGNIHVGYTRQEVIARLGPPLRQDDPKEMKDPGMTYADMQINVSEIETVRYLSSESPKYCTPHGICPGMPFAKAKEVYAAIHEKTLADGSISAWFGSRFDCRLAFRVQQGVIRSIFVGCPYWDAERTSGEW